MLLTGGGSSQTTEMASSSPQMSPMSMAADQKTVAMFKTDAKKGNYLTDGRGMTLYTFDKDKTNVSNCTGQCASLWPAYMTTTAPATMPQNIAVFKTAGNGLQYTYKGMPLYFYSADKNPGDINGDNFGNVWHIVKQ